MKKDKAIGSLVGLAIGDALGAQVEFSIRDTVPPVKEMTGGGPHQLDAGQWTDDTSMALCLADSLINQPEFDPIDVLETFCKWYRGGYNSVNGRCFDIGFTTARGLRKFLIHHEPYGADPSDSAGNGSIMRLAPAVIRYHDNYVRAVDTAVNQGRTTHAAPEANECCEQLAKVLYKFIAGEKKEDVLEVGHYKGLKRSEIKSTGFCVHTLEASEWAVSNTDNFVDAVLLAVNLGDDADTVGAVTGQIAGALYGFENIPIHWFEKLAWNEEIKRRAELLFDKGAIAS